MHTHACAHTHHLTLLPLLTWRQALVGSGVSFNLRSSVDAAAKLQPLEVTDNVKQQVGAETGSLAVQLQQQVAM